MIQFSSYDGSHQALVKENMNAPDSYEHVKTTYNDEGKSLLVTMKFRGKNAFGGKVLNSITAKVDLQGNILKVVSQN